MKVNNAARDAQKEEPTSRRPRAQVVHSLGDDAAENAAAVAAAHEVLENWLEEDSHGLWIPGTEWGRELINALRTILGFTNTGPNDQSTETRMETVRLLAGLDPTSEAEQSWDDRFDRFLAQIDATHPALEPSESQMASRLAGGD